MKMHYVYVLRCPDTGTVRYVGCTTQPVLRERHHCRHTIYEPKTKAQAWIKQLQEEGKRPVFEIVESGYASFLHEAEWIRRFKAKGHHLLNVVFNRDAWS